MIKSQKRTNIFSVVSVLLIIALAIFAFVGCSDSYNPLTIDITNAENIYQPTGSSIVSIENGYKLTAGNSDEGILRDDIADNTEYYVGPGLRVNNTYKEIKFNAKATMENGDFFVICATLYNATEYVDASFVAIVKLNNNLYAYSDWSFMNDRETGIATGTEIANFNEIIIYFNSNYSETHTKVANKDLALGRDLNPGSVKVSTLWLVTANVPVEFTNIQVKNI